MWLRWIILDRVPDQSEMTLRVINVCTSDSYVMIKAGLCESNILEGFSESIKIDLFMYFIHLSDQKIIGNSFQPIGALITGKCIHQGFRRKVTEDVIGQIYYIWFPRILWYVSGFVWNYYKSKIEMSSQFKLTDLSLN